MVVDFARRARHHVIRLAATGEPMRAVPRTWCLHRDRDPEVGLHQLKRRSKTVSHRQDRARTLRRSDRWASASALVVIASVAGYRALALSSPWPSLVTLRHIGASPNCNAARAVGLATARRGEPGYWPSHDADKDGIACEPWPCRERGH